MTSSNLPEQPAISVAPEKIEALSRSLPNRPERHAHLCTYHVCFARSGLQQGQFPYGSLASAMTESNAERAKLASARTVGALLVGAALGIFVAPLVKPVQICRPFSPP